MTLVQTCWEQIKQILHLTAYKSHGCIRRTPTLAGQIKKKQSTNIKYDEINMINIINDDTFNLHNSRLNNDNRYRKVTQKSKLIGAAR